jgi:hypothetical protein
MSVVDKIINEWAFRCKKGYPDLNNPDDMKILKEIYSEFSIVLENQESGDAKSELINFLGQEKAEEVMQRPLYQSATVLDFVKNPQKYVTAFSDLFPLFKKNVSGKGEVIPLVAIKGAKTGGNLEKDIVAPDGTVIEVKDLGSGTEFSTASGGNPKGTIFAEHLETFMKYLAAYDTSRKYEELVKYYLTNWQRGNLKGTFFKELTKVIIEIQNSAEAYEYIKIRGKRYVIQPGQEYTISVDGDGNLSTELPQAEEKNVASSKLKNHPWVQDEDAIEKDLKTLQQKALEGIDYFLLYRNQKPIIVAKKDFDTTFTFLRFALSSLRLVYNPQDQEN